MLKHYAVEQRERAVKMVLDHLGEYRSVYAACQAIGSKVGVGVESLRRWVLQAQVDTAERPDVTSAEAQRIKDLEREVRDRSQRAEGGAANETRPAYLLPIFRSLRRVKHFAAPNSPSAQL